MAPTQLILRCRLSQDTGEDYQTEEFRSLGMLRTFGCRREFSEHSVSKQQAVFHGRRQRRIVNQKVSQASGSRALGFRAFELHTLD